MATFPVVFKHLALWLQGKRKISLPTSINTETRSSPRLNLYTYNDEHSAGKLFPKSNHHGYQ